ncbi:MAG: alpha/beta fold hydrolase [Pseudomonadota bacterium]
MPDGGTYTDWAKQLAESQQAFWAAAAKAPAFADASAFAPPDWQAFDGFASKMLAQLDLGTGPDWQAAHAALTAYRNVIMDSWSRIQRDFETQRLALQGLGDPDWRIFRDRWFQIAEAEFIRTQRSEAFLVAQRDLLRAAIAAWSHIPDHARNSAMEGLATAQTAVQTAMDLGLAKVQVAKTPKKEIWRHGRTSLSRYLPLDGRAPSLGPVVLCHGLIGRQTMTDLQPDRSLVRNLLAAGVDVFVVDWGNAGSEDRDLGIDHFAGNMVGACLAQTSEASGKKPILFGICQGGTIAACHTARYPGRIAGLITAVAPFDFHAAKDDPDPAHGLLHLWIESLDREDIDALVGLTGNLSGVLLGMIFNQLNPVRTLRKYAVDMVEQAGAPGGPRIFVAMEKWLADRPDLPGAVARTWLKDLYMNNALFCRDLLLNGEKVDLSAINVPTLNVFASNDHIVPPPCSRALGCKISANYQELAVPTGHIGAFVSAGAQTLLSTSITSWLATLR